MSAQSSSCHGWSHLRVLTRSLVDAQTDIAKQHTAHHRVLVMQQLASPVVGSCMYSVPRALGYTHLGLW